MTNSDGSVIINIDSNVDKVARGFQNLDKNVNKLDSSAQDLISGGFARLEKALSQVTGGINQLGTASTNNNKALIQINSTLKEMGKLGESTSEKIKPPQAKSEYESFEQTLRRLKNELREMAFAGDTSSESFKNLSNEAKYLQERFDNANSAVNKAIRSQKNLDISTTTATTSTNGLIGAFGKFATTGAAILVLRQAVQYSKESVGAFREQERALLSLDNALMNVGVYSAQYSDSLKQLSSEIQGYSNYGDETVQKAVALGQAYSGNTALTKDLIKATVDYAAATETDLHTAFTLVGKSIGTNTNALARYGVELDSSMTKEEKMEAITATLEQRFNGSAATMADGSVQLQNALGDLSEVFGQILNPTVEKAENILIRSVKALTQWINRTRILNSTVLNQLSTEDLNERLKKRIDEYAELKSKFSNFEGSNAQKEIRAEMNELAGLIKLRKAAEKQRQKQSAKNYKPINYNEEEEEGGILSKGHSSGVTRQNQLDAYQKLQQQSQSSLQHAKALAAANNGELTPSVQEAINAFLEYNAKLEKTNALFKNLQKESSSVGGAFSQLQNQISSKRTALLDMAASGNYSAEFYAAKAELQALQAESDRINSSITNSIGLNWSDVSRNISSQLSYALTTPLQQGENAFERFGNIAINTIQSIAQKLLTSGIENLFSGKVGSSGGSLLGTAGSAIGTFFGPVGTFVGGAIGNIAGKLFKHANGAAFYNGNHTAFANGGVVSSPTTFPMSGNRTGLMGEAGPEAIMPLKRTANGQLGVQAIAQPANVNIYNQSGASIETVQRPDGETDIFIKRVNQALRSERTQTGFSSALQRNQSRGVQAS